MGGRKSHLLVFAKKNPSLQEHWREEREFGMLRGTKKAGDKILPVGGAREAKFG